jgi:uncharacterized protein YceK
MTENLGRMIGRLHNLKESLKEMQDAEQMDEVYSPAHEVTKQVPASVNGVRAKKLYDMGYGKVLDTTLLPNRRQLKIELRKEEQAL